MTPLSERGPLTKQQCDSIHQLLTFQQEGTLLIDGFTIQRTDAEDSYVYRIYDGVSNAIVLQIHSIRDGGGSYFYPTWQTKLPLKDMRERFREATLRFYAEVGEVAPDAAIDTGSFTRFDGHSAAFFRWGDTGIGIVPYFKNATDPKKLQQAVIDFFKATGSEDHIQVFAAGLEIVLSDDLQRVFINEATD